VTQNNAEATVVIVAYRPKPGKRDDLLQLLREHVPYLRSEGLATERQVVFAEGSDGSIIEVFEWTSGGVEKAHKHPGVGKLWERFFAACDAVPLHNLPESSSPFASFKPLDL
jgi:hypothetical protein